MLDRLTRGVGVTGIPDLPIREVRGSEMLERGNRKYADNLNRLCLTNWQL